MTFTPGQVMGIQADADYYHIKCAIDAYGEQAIKTVVRETATGASDDDALALFLEDKWPADREGNPIHALVTPEHDESIYGATYSDGAQTFIQYPAVCGRCLHYLASVEDIRIHGGPLDDEAVQL
jgi:hypothetical protein